LNPTTTAQEEEVYVGVDISKDRLDVFVRRGEAGRHVDEDIFIVPHDDAGIDALLLSLAWLMSASRACDPGGHWRFRASCGCRALAAIWGCQ
jgi:hypothetical protein